MATLTISLTHQPITGCRSSSSSPPRFENNGWVKKIIEERLSDFSTHTAPLIATGATAVVLSHRDLAVKLFPSSRTALAAFEHERDVYEHLNRESRCESVVQYFGTWDTALALERMDGTLWQRLQNLPPVSEKMQDLWIMELAKGLAFLHGKGVVHGDISTRHILLARQHIRICDFAGANLGDGKAIVQYEVSNQKPCCMSNQPEVRKEISAFGSVVFEIVTGAMMFAGLKDSEVRERFETREWPVLEGQREGLRRVVDGCWNGKYSCFEEILGDLKNLISYRSARAPARNSFPDPDYPTSVVESNSHIS